MGKTLVLAEPGCTAQGDYAAYVRLINTAAQCGADVLKNQWCSDPEQMCARRHITPEHPKYTYYRKAYGYLNFPVDWHADFARLCKEAGIQYACTAFLPQDVATLAPHVEYLKIASFEARDPELLYALNKPLFDGKRAIISCGMSDEDATPRDALYRAGVRGFAYSNVSWLHCVSAYPAPVSDMCLSVLEPDPDGFGHQFHGLSDHSRDVDMGGFAVCAGAQIIEAHFRLYDCSPENPDYAVAFDPGEFTEYILKIRKAERALGDGVKRIQESEKWALEYRVQA